MKDYILAFKYQNEKQLYYLWSNKYSHKTSGNLEYIDWTRLELKDLRRMHNNPDSRALMSLEEAQRLMKKARKRFKMCPHKKNTTIFLLRASKMFGLNRKEL